MTKRILALLAAVALTGCSIDEQTAPPLSGPSELGLAVGVTATPDIITQDGQSQATIRIQALDASSQPVSGLVLRAETVVDGQPVDLGVLSSKTVSTGADGRATLTYRSPAAPPPSQTSDIVVEVAVTPVGTNYTGANAKSATIRLARPGIILPTNGTPVPRFYFSPTSPAADDEIFFDGSASTDSDGTVVTYTWSWGDGRTTTSSSPTARHQYGLAGTYNVVLTVTDNAGMSASTSPMELSVGLTADPSAVFVTSPAAPKVGGNVGFNASASKAVPGHSITTYVWEFGDGTPVVTTSNPIVNHQFAAVGGYNVTLKVIDDTGRFAVRTNTVTIAP